MPSPIVTFRITPHQIARGLAIIRNIDPTYKLTSISQLVKIIYNDYLAKITQAQPTLVDPAILEEVNLFINSPMKRALNLIDLIEQEYLTKED